MGWYTFIFSNEINHHHSYYHFHKPKEQDRESPHFHSAASYIAIYFVELYLFTFWSYSL